jgi:hypothetical protein
LVIDGDDGHPTGTGCPLNPLRIDSFGAQVRHECFSKPVLTYTSKHRNSHSKARDRNRLIGPFAARYFVKRICNTGFPWHGETVRSHNEIDVD